MEINPMKTSNIIVNYTLPHISELFSIVGSAKSKSPVTLYFLKTTINIKMIPKTIFFRNRQTKMHRLNYTCPRFSYFGTFLWIFESQAKMAILGEMVIYPYSRKMTVFPKILNFKLKNTT